MNALDKLKEAATIADNSYIQKFKESSGKVIGYQCSFLPLGEIYHAAGMMGFRLRANEAKATTIGDTYYGAVICSYPKCMLHMAGEGKYNFLDGLVTSTGCDAMRRMYDCWRKADEEYTGILPDFFEMLAIPHKSLDFNQEWFIEEIGIHIKKIEEYFGVKITEESIAKSVVTFNKARKLLKELDTLRIGKDMPISGADVLAIHLASCGMPIDDFIPLVEEVISDIKKEKNVHEGKRIMLVGSVNDDIGFVKSIEDEGCVIIADTLCFGSRFYENNISENGNPVEALAIGYLDDVKCPRMIGAFKERRQYMMDKAKKAEIDGVLFQNIRFCDLHGSENGVLERDFENIGMPCIGIERDYGANMDSGRVKMRVDAFLRRIK